MENPQKAVVQVKGGYSVEVDALDYKSYSDEGYLVYIYAPTIINLEKVDKAIRITKEELVDFYTKYKAILPSSITNWEHLF